MNGATRTKFRNELKSLFDAVFDIGDVNATRVYSAREGSPFVEIYFSEGVNDKESLVDEAQVSLVVGIHLPVNAYSDEDLDTWGDQLLAVIEADQDITLDDDIRGITYDGFAYGEEESVPFISLNLLFTVYS